MSLNLLDKYSKLAENFKIFLKINGHHSVVERNYVFGGRANSDFFSIGIELPLFNYDSIKETDFFENQKDYDLTISKTSNLKGESIVLISVLLKDLYSENLCNESEFINILNKINNVKKEFLRN